MPWPPKREQLFMDRFLAAPSDFAFTRDCNPRETGWCIGKTIAKYLAVLSTRFPRRGAPDAELGLFTLHVGSLQEVGSLEYEPAVPSAGAAYRAKVDAAAELTVRAAQGAPSATPRFYRRVLSN